MGFGEMEVPQVTRLNDRLYMLFASELSTQAPCRRATGTGTGTYYLTADSPRGPFAMTGLRVLEADQIGSNYAGKLVDWGGELWFLAWERAAADGSFVGGIGSPRRVLIEPTGKLSLEPAAETRRGRS